MTRFISFSFVFILNIGFFADNAHAVSLTSHRIYLDKDQRSESFVVYNKNTYGESCQLSMIDFPFADDGTMGNVITGALPENSAKHLVRFSPRRFDIEAGKTQAIRLSLGRKSGMGEAEYHSYLSVKCTQKKAANTEELISIAPRVVHNVPIVARTGSLNASLSFDNLAINDQGKLTFRIIRTGNRSVYGVLQLLDKSTGNVVNQLNGVSIYTQSSFRDFDFSVESNININNTILKFVESKRYGGSLSIEKEVNL